MEASSTGSNEQATGIEALDAIFAPVKARREELETEREGLMGQVAVIDDELKRLNAVLRAAFPEAKPQPTPKKKSNGNGVVRPGTTGRGISVEKTDELEAWVRNWLKDNDAVSQTDARLHLGWDQSRVSAGFAALRDRNVLRLAGARGSMKIYRPTATVEAELHAA